MKSLFIDVQSKVDLRYSKQLVTLANT